MTDDNDSTDRQPSIDDKSTTSVLDNYLLHLERDHKITGGVYVSDCRVPAVEILDLIHGFTRPLMRTHESGAWAFNGSSVFLKYRGKFLAISTEHQLRQGGEAPTHLDNVVFSLRSNNQFVRPHRIHSDNGPTDDGFGIALYELRYYTQLGNSISDTVFYPISWDRIWPSGAMDDVLLVCGFPSLIDPRYGPSPLITPPEWDEKKSDTTYGHISTSNVLMPAKKIQSETRGGMMTLQLLFDGAIDVDRLSGSPIFYIGRDAENAFLGFAGVVNAGSNSSKKLNYTPGCLLMEYIDAFVFELEIQEIVRRTEQGSVSLADKSIEHTADNQTNDENA